MRQLRELAAQAQAQHQVRQLSVLPRSVRHRAGVLTNLARLRRVEESSKNSTADKIASLAKALRLAKASGARAKRNASTLDVARVVRRCFIPAVHRRGAD